MDIKKYQFEISHIIDELKSLENGCFYEEGCQAHPGSASAKTIAKNIKEEFIDLMKKIKEDAPDVF